MELPRSYPNQVESSSFSVMHNYETASAQATDVLPVDGERRDRSRSSIFQTITSWRLEIGCCLLGFVSVAGMLVQLSMIPSLT
jgi:hypothetical protein